MERIGPLDPILQELVDAQKGNNQQTVESAVAQIYTDADRISDFLSQIHAHWSNDQWQNLLYQQNELILLQLDALLSGEVPA